MITPLPSLLPLGGGPASHDDPSSRNTVDRTSAVAAAAAGVPPSDQRVAQMPRPREPTIQSKSRVASGIAHPRSVSRKSLRIVSARAVRETDEEKRAAQPTVLASPSCDPPYVIDDDGIKRFKLSCL